MDGAELDGGHGEDLLGKLRERKKARTRRALVVEALESFALYGADAVTLDDLCLQVGVSKRTFFRYFTSKEDVAMKPLQDLWLEFLRRLESEPLSRNADVTVLSVLHDTLVVSIRECADRDSDWIHLVRLALGLDAVHTSFAAHNLRFCDEAVRAALGVLAPGLGISVSDDPRLRLLLGMFLVATRDAQRTWILRTDDNEGAESLILLVDHTVAALSASLGLKAPRLRACLRSETD
ncbi:TetR/AcrR family transcriptional regulator [Streptomyces scopuliridis]|uniref:TetR/AcrR family transcriptional regulator n=1 Tax=Streptomyces scopuliridis TaxID=452529 RepID=UPI0036A6C19C